MQIVKLSEVQVPEYRVRKQFMEHTLQELASSILSPVGLMHPLVVRRKPDGLWLVSGGRRRRALELIHDKTYLHGDVWIEAGHVPVVTYDELPEHVALEAELTENVLRDDLTMQERAAATARLHNLRAQLKAEQGLVQTIKATAEEVVGDDPSGYAQQQVRDLIIISQHLDNPEVAKARTVKEAIKVISREAATLFAEELATRVDLTRLDSVHRLIQGECIAIDAETHVEDRSRSILRTFGEKIFDVILTDPPYGVGADTWTAQSGSEAATKHQYGDSFERVYAMMKPFMEESFRVAKDRAHMYMFCDIRLWPVWAKMATEAGWSVWPVPLIWNKNGQGMIIGNVDGPRRTYEAILYARCGGKGVQKVGADVITVAPPQAELHAAQKPVDLYETLLSWSAVAGDSVLDAFAGSGTIFPACNRLRLVATAIEMRPENVLTASKRINELDEKDVGLMKF